MKSLCRVLFLSLACIAASVASATVVRVDYSFNIAETFGGFPGPLNFVGQAFYDTASSPVPLSSGNVYSLLSGQLTVNGTTYQSTSGNALQNAITFHDEVPFSPPRDRIVISNQFDFFLSPTLHVLGGGFDIEGPDTIFSGASPFVPDVSQFNLLQDGFISFSNGSLCPSCAVHSFTPTISFTVVSAPEPAMPGLLGMALISLVVLSRPIRRFVGVQRKS